MDDLPIEWTAQPPPDRPKPTLELRRLKTGRLLATCLSDRPVGCFLHFWRGRTRPHLTNNCEACAAGHEPVWKGYVALWDEPTRSAWIQEFTPGAYDGLQEGIELFGTLRGHPITFERTRNASNAPMRTRVHGTCIPENRMPPTPQVTDVLTRIWDLGPDGQTIQRTESRFITHAHPEHTHHGNGPLKPTRP